MGGTDAMAERRPCQLRQAILADLDDRAPGGRDLVSLESAPNCQAIAAQRDEIMTEARCLEAGGFIKDLRPGRQPFWKITYAGIKQIRRETTPDEAIWGESAL